ncbi:hypothetical protein [Streptacidiphilus jiangxiensis]|uniref:DUF5667 domain-containing protein n=1 Tax=Streptacidiphilus jiangxiensis TaxID=235985 RepID=A0A1H7T9J7_STRJI|nr:hypothetical protein [Streptacidiphilus jiangxiensis]SEL80916.1 hypothetical protein SAMN05414137_113126 [Streptacidiphilus jiangxiensis]
MKALLAVAAVGAAAGVSVALGGCAAGPTAAAPSGPRAVTATAASPAAAYLAIAEAGNARLDKDVDRFDGPDRGRLTASTADLRDIAATERTFDQRLAQLALPARAAASARSLIAANEARATLTLRAARSTSLRQLEGLRPALTAANAPVERSVRAIRLSLALPPPDNS